MYKIFVLFYVMQQTCTVSAQDLYSDITYGDFQNALLYLFSSICTNLNAPLIINSGYETVPCNAIDYARNSA